MNLLGYVPQSTVDNLLRVNGDMENQIAGLKSTLSALRKQVQEKGDAIVAINKHQHKVNLKHAKEMKALKKDMDESKETHATDIALSWECACKHEKEAKEAIERAASLDEKLKQVAASCDDLRNHLHKTKQAKKSFQESNGRLKGMAEACTIKLKEYEVRNNELSKMIEQKDNIINAFTTLSTANIYENVTLKKRKKNNNLTICE